MEAAPLLSPMLSQLQFRADCAWDRRVLINKIFSLKSTSYEEQVRQGVVYCLSCSGCSSEGFWQ